MANLQPLGPGRRKEYEAKGLDPDAFRYNADTKEFVPYAPQSAASIGASFAQPIAELPAGAARGTAQLVGDMASAVPDWASGAVLRSMGPSLLAAKGVSTLSQPAVDALAAVPRSGSAIEGGAGVLGSLAGGLGLAAVPGAGLPALIGAYGANRYGDIRAKGGSPLTAGVGGAIDAAAVAVPPLKTMGMPIGRAMVKGGLLGGGVNAGQQLAQNALADATYAPGTALGKDLIGNVALGVGLGGGISGMQARGVKPATQADVNQLAAQPASVDPTKPPILSMGGSDNLTGAQPSPTRTPQEQFAAAMRTLQEPGKSQAEYTAAKEFILQHDPSITPDELLNMTAYSNRMPAEKWVANVRSDPARMVDFGDNVIKAAAKLLKAGYPLTDEDIIAIQRTPERTMSTTVNALKAKYAAEAVALVKAKEAEATKLAQAETDRLKQIEVEAKRVAEERLLAEKAAAVKAEMEAAAVKAAEVPPVTADAPPAPTSTKGQPIRLAPRASVIPPAEPVPPVIPVIPADQQPVPIPENSASIAEQLRLTADPASDKVATLFVPGTPIQNIPAGLEVTSTDQGIVAFNPDQTTVEAVKAAGAKGQDFNGKMLGGSKVARPAADKPTVAVTLETPAAKDVITQTVEDKPAAIAEAVKVQEANAPDGKARVTTSEEIIKNRVETNEVPPTPEQQKLIDAAGIKPGTPIGEGTPYVPGDPAANNAAQLKLFEEFLNSKNPSAPPTETPAPAPVVKPTTAGQPIKRVVGKKSKVPKTPEPPTAPKAKEITSKELEELGVLRSADDEGMLSDKQQARLDELELLNAGKSSGKPVGKAAEPTPAGSATQTTGMGKGLKEKIKAKESTTKEGGFIDLSGAEDLVKRLKKRWALSHRIGKSGVKRIEDTPGGKPVAQKFVRMFEEHNILNAKGQSTLAAALSQGNKEDARLAEQFRRDMYRDGVSGVKLTPSQQRIVDGLNELALYTRYKANKEGAWINDNGTYRPGEYNQYYSPQFFRDDVWQGIKANDPTLRKQLVDQFRREGRSADEANEVFNSLGSEKSMVSGDNVDFGPLRRPEGVNFPVEWLKGPQDSWVSYLHKWAADVAASKHIEQDPFIGNLRGDLNDSRGGKHAEDKDAANNTVLANEVRRALKSYALSLSPNLTNADKLNSIASAMTVQHESGSRDVIGTISTTWGHADTASTVKALVQALTPGSFQRGRAKGYSESFHKNNAESAGLFAGGNLLGHVTKFMDTLKEYSGLHSIQEFTKVMSAFAGENAAIKALAEGDRKFFDRLKIEDPFGRPREEVIQEAASRVQKQATSSYDLRDLPESLVIGSPNQATRLTFGLARYAIGQTNRQLDYMTTAIKQGNPKPLIKMALGGLVGAEVVDAVLELMTDKKPAEMSWAEWFRLDMPEPARFVTSKLARANLGGYMTMLASTMMNYAGGVKAYPPKPQALDLGIDTLQNIQFMLNKMNEEGLEGRDFLQIMHEFAKDTIQDYRLVAKTFEEPNNLREQGIYNRIEKGEKQMTDLPSANPLLTNTRFNRATDINEIDALGGKIIDRGAAGETIPAIKNSLNDPDFYDWLNRLQPGQGDVAFDRDRDKQLGVNRLKADYIKRANTLKEAGQKGKPSWDTKGRLQFK